MPAKRVQFNVRVRADVARDLRNEAALRSIGMGELVELLNENYRAGTRSGHWLELEPPLEAALTALAAVRGEPAERVLQGLVAGVVREQLQGILDHLPSRENILSGEVLATLRASVQPGSSDRQPGAPIHAPESDRVDELDDLDELEIDASGWIEPDHDSPALDSIELEALSDADISIEAMEWDGDDESESESESESEQLRLTAQSAAAASETAPLWSAGDERRKRSREITLSDADQQRFDALPPGLPRSGEDLLRFRLAHGLSAVELGSMCGVTQVAVGLWERKGPLPAPILLKLGAGLSRYFS